MLFFAGLALALLLGLSRPASAQDESETATDPMVAFGIAGNSLDDSVLGGQRGAGGARQNLEAGLQAAVILWDERGKPRPATSYGAVTGHDNVQSVTVTIRAN